MNVKEYIKIRKEELDKFEAYWLEMQSETNSYPKELEKSWWYEQEFAFYDSEC
jgi:hypothetical protein